MAQLVTQSDYHTGVKPMPVAQGAEVLAVRDTVAILTTKSLSDIAAMMPLPADHIPVDVILDFDDMDTGTSETWSMGVLNAGKTDLSTTTADGGAVWVVNTTAAQTGVIARPTTKTITRVKPSRTVRYLGLKLTAAGSATAGTVGITLLYRAAHYEAYDS